MKLRGLSPNSFIDVSVSDLYIPTIRLPVLLQENSLISGSTWIGFSFQCVKNHREIQQGWSMDEGRKDPGRIFLDVYYFSMREA
jgi:hypothetical protein